MQVNLLTQDQLQSFIDAIVLKVENLIKDSQKKETASKEWLTAKEVCQLLKISHTTLHDWSNKGIVKKYRIGDRIRFRHDQVQESLLALESKRRRI